MAGQRRKLKPSTYRSHLLDVYGADIYLATTKPQWRALARRITALDANIPQSAGMTWFAIFQPNSGAMPTPTLVIWVDVAQHHDQGNLIDTLAHEASHAAGALLQHIGHEHRGIDEPHAYLVGWLTRWLWEHAEWTAPTSA